MPPDNGAYMIAAYVVTGIVLVGYAVTLFIRVRDEHRKGGADQSD